MHKWSQRPDPPAPQSSKMEKIFLSCEKSRARKSYTGVLPLELPSLKWLLLLHAEFLEQVTTIYSLHCFLTPVHFSCIFQAALHLVENISLSNFIIKNLLIFSTSPITCTFREPMPLVLPPQQTILRILPPPSLQVAWPTFDFKESSPLRAALYLHYTKMQSLWKEQCLATHRTAKVPVNSLIMSKQLEGNKEQIVTILQ